jgi:hypothetical protein
MHDDPTRSPSAVSRRTALAGVAAGGLGVALGTRVRLTSAQDATASHPIVGVWNAVAPGGPSVANFQADGSVTFAAPANYVDPALGVVFQGSSMGTWEPTGERSIHGTWITYLSDGDGTFLGTVTIDGYPEVSADGRSLTDDQSRVMITIRDAAGVVVQEIAPAGAPPVIGNRIEVGQPNFPPSTPTAGTPTAGTPTAGTPTA